MLSGIHENNADLVRTAVTVLFKFELCNDVLPAVKSSVSTSTPPSPLNFFSSQEVRYAGPEIEIFRRIDEGCEWYAARTRPLCFLTWFDDPPPFDSRSHQCKASYNHQNLFCMPLKTLTTGQTWTEVIRRFRLECAEIINTAP
jgi:hypothetical protein